MLKSRVTDQEAMLRNLEERKGVVGYMDTQVRRKSIVTKNLLESGLMHRYPMLHSV